MDIDLPGLAGLNSDLRILGGGGAGLLLGLNIEAHLGLHLATLEFNIIIKIIYYFEKLRFVLIMRIKTFKNQKNLVKSIR